jgi:uncharacterized protein (DUF4415 family)
MAGEDIRRYSIEQIGEMNARGDFHPPPPDAPEYELPEEFWEYAEKVVAERRRPRVSIHLRVKPDVLATFKAEGPGHLTRMAEVLEAYIATRDARRVAPPAPVEPAEPAE